MTTQGQKRDSNSETVGLEVTLSDTMLCSKTGGLTVKLRKCMHDQEPKKQLIPK